MKWNESGFRPPLCTYRLNWARRTSRGWWDEWDDTVIQTQDSKFEPCRSEAEHATSRSRRLPTILTFPRGWGRNIFCFFQTAETGNRTPNSGVKGSDANHHTRTPAQNLVQFTNVIDSCSWQYIYCAKRKTIHLSLEKHAQAKTISSYLVGQASLVWSRCTFWSIISWVAVLQISSLIDLFDRPWSVPVPTWFGPI